MWTYHKYMSGCSHQCWPISPISRFSWRSVISPFLSARLMDASGSLNRCWGAVANIADRCMHTDQVERPSRMNLFLGMLFFSLPCSTSDAYAPFFVCASLWDPTFVYTLNQPTGNYFLRTRWIWVYLPCNNFSDWVVANQRPPTKTFLNKPLRVVVFSYYQLLDLLKSRINVVIVWMGKLENPHWVEVPWTADDSATWKTWRFQQRSTVDIGGWW